MSSLLFSTTITLILLSATLPFATPEAILDTDGDPIFNGGDYYLLPAKYKGGLTLQETDNYCPYYITTGKTENSPGIPVRINSPNRIRFITSNLPLTIGFSGWMPCHLSPVWGKTLDRNTQREYITINGNSRSRPRFGFTKGDVKQTYEIKYRSPDGTIMSNVGFFEDNDVLGLTENSTAVTFKKAFYYDANNPQLSTS